MNKKLNFIFKQKKKYKIILYLFTVAVIIFSIYFSIPNFFNYSTKQIEENLKKNSELNIKNISNIDYRFFPSPRLRLSGSTLEAEESILEVKGAEIDIILKSLNIINFKKIDYNKLLIRGGTTRIQIEKINQLFDYIKKNKKKINFQKNKIILLQDKKKLFEITENKIKINRKNKNSQLSINGFFLNHRISFLLINKSKNNSKIILKITELDISTDTLIDSKNNFTTFDGLLNLEVLNNFFRFSFTKNKNFIINKGFMRNELINSSLKGEVSFRPHFFFNLDIEPTAIDVKKLFPIIQKKYFSGDAQKLKILKKINGSLNFRTMIEGKVIFENKKILFKNFKIGNDDPIFFNAKIFDLGKKGKIQFDLSKNIQNKDNTTKELKISGLIIPFTSNVIFKKILLDKKILRSEKIKKYEKKFKIEVLNTSLSNIFNETLINNYLKNFIN